MNWKKIIAIGLTGCFLFSGCAEQRQNAQKIAITRLMHAIYFCF